MSEREKAIKSMADAMLAADDAGQRRTYYVALAAVAYDAAALRSHTNVAALIAERDEARNRNASLELEAVGYSNRMHEAIARAEIAEEALAALTQHRSHLMNEPASITIPDNFDWPPQAILILQFGISIGKSYAQIADALSAEFKRTITADAVSSKANRDLRREATKCSA